MTSGMGGRFPAGFPVASIESLKPNETGLFMVGRAKPAARLDRGLEVLLVNEIIPSPPTQPPPVAATTKPLLEASGNIESKAAESKPVEKKPAPDSKAKTDSDETP